MMKNKMQSMTDHKYGIRESKRRNTHQRITETAIRLFLEQGYDAITLDAIAAAADISRRSFFAYFKSKDEILRTWQLSGWQSFLDEVRQISPDQSPRDAVRHTFSTYLSQYQTEQLKSIAKVMSSSTGLQATKHAAYAEQETALFEVLCEVWRQPERKLALRLLAMSTVGAIRVAVEIWEQPDNQHSLQHLFGEALDTLKSALS